MLSQWERQREGHQDLLHPGERSLKGENKDGRRAEGDGEAADEVVDNVQQGQLGVIGSTYEIKHMRDHTHVVWIGEDGEGKHW